MSEFFKFRWLTMMWRHFDGLKNADTRLWYGVLGLPMVVAGFASAFTGQSPALTLALLFGGSSIMRIQASLVERAPMKNLRNGAAIIAVLMVLLAWWLDDYVWTGVGMAIAIGLLMLHFAHEKWLDERGYVLDGYTSFADQMNGVAPRVS